jgi:hypothetical protein
MSLKPELSVVPKKKIHGPGRVHRTIEHPSLQTEIRVDFRVILMKGHGNSEFVSQTRRGSGMIQVRMGMENELELETALVKKPKEGGGFLSRINHPCRTALLRVKQHRVAFEKPVGKNLDSKLVFKAHAPGIATGALKSKKKLCIRDKYAKIVFPKIRVRIPL